MLPLNKLNDNSFFDTKLMTTHLHFYMVKGVIMDQLNENKIREA